MFMFEMPEEMREEMRKRMEEHQLQVEDYYHSVQHLFDELNKDQLHTLRWILHNVSADETGKLASYYEGQVANMLQVKYSVCPGCGKDHTEELLEQQAAPDQPTEKPAEVVPQHTGPSLTDEDKAKMEEYNLDDAYEAGSERFIGFICKGCGLLYPSIDDRMLKAPDECHGCQQKAMWG